MRGGEQGGVKGGEGTGDGVKSEEDEDEDYGKSKKRKVTPPKKTVRRNVTANEPAGMRALRDYTSALKLG